MSEASPTRARAQADSYDDADTNGAEWVDWTIKPATGKENA